MAEQTTTPATAVEQGPPSADSLESILEAQFGDTPEPKPPKEQPEPEKEAATDDDGPELTADDIIDDEEPKAPQSEPNVEFEIVHNGQQHRLSREETIKLAQQGFDYAQGTQRLSDER